MKIMFVGIGGFFGAISRFLVGQYVLSINGFPMATFIVNIAGCFALGLLYGVHVKRKINNNMVLLLGTGFLGAFTTFSTFSLELIRLLSSQQFILFFLYGVASLLFGILLVFIGFRMGGFCSIRYRGESK